MGATITVLNGGQRVATTDRAFDTVVTKELMRDWALSFNVTNRDNARQYAIDPNAQFIVEGQIYDTEKYKQSSGTDNATEVSASHVLARMNKYMIPAGYAFVGTIAALIQDILTQSGASAEFTVGTCADLGTQSYSLGNTQPTDAFSAIAFLTRLGVEPSYDNFTINAPVRWGADTGKVFKFGRDLCLLERTFDKTTTPWTYSYAIDVANLQRLPGGSPSDTFVTGDTVGIQDALIGDSIIGQRIISYEKCLDDPTQDKVTIGNFISDLSDSLTTMQVDISTSVQQGATYDNVGFTHQHGMRIVSGDNTIMVQGNSANCFAVYKGDGSGNENSWILMSELDLNGVQAGTLTMPGYPNFKVIVGKGPNSGDGLGLFIIDTNISEIPFLKFWLDSGGNTVIQKTRGDLIFEDENGVGIGTNGTSNPTAAFTVKEGLVTGWSYPIAAASGTIGPGNIGINVSEGLITGWNYPTTWSGTVPINSGANTLHFTNGVLTSIT
jgi:hypothetical protein